MNRKEAIEQLQKCKDLIKQNGHEHLDERDFPLLDVAIEALQMDIVHCKECKYYGNLYDGDCEHPAVELGELLATEPTDFCSYGERRE